MNIVFQFKKGILSTTVQAGLLIISSTLVAGCGKQPESVEAEPVRLASAPIDNSEQKRDEIPVVVVTGSRTPKS